MLDNKKKIVKGITTAAALTGAFIAPATAQAADNIETPFDMMDGIQNAEATEARQQARKERDKAKSQAKAYHELKKLNQNQNKNADAEKKFESKLNNLFVDKSGDKDLKTARGSYNKALRDYGRKVKDKNKGKADDAAVKEAKVNLDAAKQQYDDQLEAAKNGATNNDIYTSLMVEGNQLIDAQKQAEKNYETVVSQEWGNWTKEHSVTDKSQDTEFQNLIPEFQKLVQKERKAIPADKIAAQRLDPSKLFLKDDHNVRVWFLDEGAGYKNELAYEAFNGDDYDKGMIFDDVSCKSGCQLSNGRKAPLEIGDFVDLGLIEGGTQLNFLLRADGANGTRTRNGDIYGVNESLNADGLQHLMAFAVQAGGRDYMMMGFEDLRNGGDKDYNDAMFIVDFGENNLTNTPTKFAQAAKVPEASNIAAILGVTGASMMLSGVRRRRKK